MNGPHWLGCAISHAVCLHHFALSVSESPSGEFRCAHGKRCILASRRCDGSADCTDHSDEMGCQVPTRGCDHRCSDGLRCIPSSFVCDGEIDCVDRSDERNCGEWCRRLLVQRGEIEAGSGWWPEFVFCQYFTYLGLVSDLFLSIFLLTFFLIIPLSEWIKKNTTLPIVESQGDLSRNFISVNLNKIKRLKFNL